MRAVTQFDDVHSKQVDLLIPRMQDESSNKVDADESMVSLIEMSR